MALGAAFGKSKRLALDQALGHPFGMPLVLALLARCGQRRVDLGLTDGGRRRRAVLLEFDSVAAALAAYDSPAYKEALVALGDNAVVREIRIIEGV